jgi:hypothetical protein
VPSGAAGTDSTGEGSAGTESTGEGSANAEPAAEGERGTEGEPGTEGERVENGSTKNGSTKNGEEGWAHFGPAPERVPGRLGRITRRVGRVAAHEWTLICLGALLIAVAMTWPAALHPSTTIPADIWDPTLQAWELAWAGHAITTDPTQLWNANAFFPDPYSFAFSDTLLGYLPAGLIGTGPTVALVRYNVLFILLHALAFLGPYALVRQLGARPAAAAVAGAAFAFAPWHWSQAGHLHVLSDGGMALALAMLARGHGYSFTRGFQRDQIRPGWALAGWCVAAWQLSLGFGIGLPFAYVLALIVVVAAIRWLLRGRPALGRRLLIFNGAGALLFGAVGGAMGWPYLQVIKLHPEAADQRSLAAVQLYSPPLRAFLTAPEKSLPWGSAHAAARATMSFPPEWTLLPGFMLIGLAAAGLFFSVWRLRVRLWLLAGTLVSVYLAMGTQPWYDGKYGYLLLYDYLPFWSASRTPGRLVIWTTLLLGILAAGAVGAFVERSHDLAAQRMPRRPSLMMRLATLLPVMLVLVEGTNKLDHPVVPTQPAAMRSVQGPLLVLPSDPLTDENVMLWSTTRFQKMVNGGSGFYPTDQTTTRETAKAFPDQISVDYLRRLGIRNVIVLKAQASGSDYAKAAAPDTPIDGLGVTRRDDGDTITYTLD